MKKEVNIVGAGISGLTAAINLAKANYKVKVFEKEDVIGKRFYNDYQGLENWMFERNAIEHLKVFNIEADFFYRPGNTGKVIGPNGQVHHYEFSRPFFYLVRRGMGKGALDQSLYRQAKKAGVEIIFNSPKDHREFGDIIAQGYFPDKVTDAIVIGHTFQTNLDDQYWIILDDNIAPDGYAYFLIADNQATLAVCIFNHFEKSEEYLERAYKAFQAHIDFKMKDKKLWGGTSNFFWNPKTTQNGRLYVGEAGGFIDMGWGFGMKYAMLSGYLAARSIVQNKSYDRLIKKYIQPSLKASVVNRWYHRHLNKKGYEIFIKRMEKIKDPMIWAKKVNRYTIFHRLSFPIASLCLKKKMKDRRKME